MAAYKALPGWTRKQIRSEISLINLMLLLKVIPPYRSEEKKKDEGKDSDKKEKAGKGSKSDISEFKHWEQFNF